MNATEAIRRLQFDLVASEEDRTEAVSILMEIKKHTRFTDKNNTRFTSEFSEPLYDRFHKFLKKHAGEL